MEKKLTVDKAKIEGKRVLVRVDYNVPLEGTRVADDTRIRGSLPTVRHLLERGARPILVSHLGRPDGKVVESLRMDPVVKRAGELLGRPVRKAPGCIESEVQGMARAMKEGDVLFLENVRFYAGEEEGDPKFAGQLAALAEAYVNDAFGACHRPHASVVGVTRHLSSSAGLLLKKEIEYARCIFESGETPFAAVLGGAKVSDKIPILESLIETVDSFLIGGAMAYTFLRARGVDVGASRVEEACLETAARILEKCEAGNVRALLPVDHVVARSPKDTAGMQTVTDIPAGWMGCDIGPQTAALYEGELARSRMVILNGPMGVFENPKFAQGTKRIVRAMAESQGVTIVGGGDSVHAVETFGAAERMSHISTGGGAFLEMLAHRTLPGIEALAGA
ncbi:MAG: phosphoglycerate kinase [Planctomycetes bacterium]|nr:phosphoglycerate kinase [Planctomycetota bacterium]